MKKLLPLIVTLLLTCTLEAQQPTADEIVSEGRRLYRSEMASWYGTDIFLERFGSLRIQMSGYLSYPIGDSTRCIFFSRGENPEVMVSIDFDTSFSTAKAVVNSQRRKFSVQELDLFLIRQAGVDGINNDTLFKVYDNTSLNVIPVVNGTEKKMYVLTGPKKHGVVVFGNDYLLTFNQNNELISKKKLHKNIILLDAKKDDGVVATIHSHLNETGAYITATDICTLMLYSRFTGWQQHIVISPSHVSIWDVRKQLLAILTREAWEKINRDKPSSDKKEKDNR